MEKAIYDYCTEIGERNLSSSKKGERFTAKRLGTRLLKESLLGKNVVLRGSFLWSKKISEEEMGSALANLGCDTSQGISLYYGDEDLPDQDITTALRYSYLRSLYISREKNNRSQYRVHVGLSESRTPFPV